MHRNKLQNFFTAVKLEQIIHKFGLSTCLEKKLSKIDTFS